MRKQIFPTEQQELAEMIFREADFIVYFNTIRGKHGAH